MKELESYNIRKCSTVTLRVVSGNGDSVPPKAVPAPWCRERSPTEQVVLFS